MFVWENLLAHRAVGENRAYAKAIRRRQWEKAVGMWELDPIMRQRLHHLSWQFSIAVDILCITAHPGFANALKARLEEDHYPFSWLLRFTLAEFNRELAFRPEITTVYHGETASPFLFGSRGHLVGNSHTLDIQ